MSSKQSGFNMDEWYHREETRIIDALAKAIIPALNIGDHETLNFIRKKIEAANLKDKACLKCGTKMAAVDWYFNMFFCTKCIDKGIKRSQEMGGI